MNQQELFFYKVTLVNGNTKFRSSNSTLLGPNKRYMQIDWCLNITVYFLVIFAWFVQFTLFQLNRLGKHIKSLKLSCLTKTIECGFPLKLVRDMIITYIQMHRTDKYSQHSSIIWPVWLNGWVSVYEPRGCGVESRCCYLNFRYGACFGQGVSWHSDKL